jgi:hypothetical protein
MTAMKERRRFRTRRNKINRLRGQDKSRDVRGGRSGGKVWQIRDFTRCASEMPSLRQLAE